MRFAVAIPNADHFGDVDTLVGLANAAEEEGWDGFFLWDHLLFTHAQPVPVCDPWTTLGAIAKATNRLKLGTLITPVARYEPWALAQAIMTLDRLSHGRVIVGVGLGSPDDDFLPFWKGCTCRELRARRSRYREGLALLTRLLTGQTINHSGKNYELHNVTLLPGGHNGRTIPMWVGGDHENHFARERANHHHGAVPIAWGADGYPRALMEREVTTYVKGLAAGLDFAYWNPADITPLSPTRASAIESAGATWWIETTKHGRPRSSQTASVKFMKDCVNSYARLRP